MIRRDVFQAISDPVRREILELLAQQPSTINEIAEHFTISRPAISRHIKILKACGTILIVPSGRQRTCQINFKAFGPVSNWLETIGKNQDRIKTVESYTDFLALLSPDPD